jgi:hypothetical protein
MAMDAHAAKEEEISLLPSMERAQTIEYFKAHGIKPLGLTSSTCEEFKPSGPVLYVFQDSFPIGIFHIPNPTRRPSIARIDNPLKLRFGGDLINDGQTDYYAIEPETKEIFLVNSGSKKEYSSVGFPYLFEACDALFPKGPPLE